MPPPPLKPLSLGELLDVAFGLYRAQFIPLLIITMTTALLPAAIQSYVESAGGTFEHLPLALVNGLLDIVLGSVAVAATTLLVAEGYLNRNLSAGEAFRRAKPFLGRVLAAALIAGLLCGIGMLFLIIPGIIIFVGLAVSTPALVLENLGARAALSRSWMLTRGHRKRIFNSIAVAFLLMSIPMFALGGYAASRMAEDPTLGVVVSTEALVLNAVAAFLAALMRPLFYCLLTVVYYDLRVRKEAYDLELLAGDQVAP